MRIREAQSHMKQHLKKYDRPQSEKDALVRGMATRMRQDREDRKAGAAYLKERKENAI